MSPATWAEQSGGVTSAGRRGPVRRGWLRALSDWECDRFRNRNLRRPGRRRRVHAVDLREWFGVPMPTPACNQAMHPLSLARTKAVIEPVDCERCLAIRGTAVTPLTSVHDDGQLTLFDSAGDPEEDDGEHDGGPGPRGA